MGSPPSYVYAITAFFIFCFILTVAIVKGIGPEKRDMIGWDAFKTKYECVQVADPIPFGVVVVTPGGTAMSLEGKAGFKCKGFDYTFWR